MAKTATRKPAAKPKSKAGTKSKQPGPPKLEPVDSTLLEAIAYDEATGDLYARLKDTGETYRYAEVPTQVYEQLLAAESKGQFFEKWVRGKSYPAEKLD